MQVSFFQDPSSRAGSLPEGTTPDQDGGCGKWKMENEKGKWGEMGHREIDATRKKVVEGV